LHPAVFGGILGRRDLEGDLDEMKRFNIPEIDLVIIDLYPFEETVQSTSDEQAIIEKIDVGGPSMIRAAAKNFKSVLVIADKSSYAELGNILTKRNAETSLDERKQFAARAFDICAGYDIAISNYFNKTSFPNPFGLTKKILRYGENPHQKASFAGDIDKIFDQLQGKADQRLNRSVRIPLCEEIDFLLGKAFETRWICCMSIAKFRFFKRMVGLLFWSIGTGDEYTQWRKLTDELMRGN